MIQNMVNRIYQRKRFDKIKPVSKFEYEQKEVRHKLDIADIYIQIAEIKDALEKQDIKLEEKSVREKEETIISMVQEDRKSTSVDLEILKYQERMEAYDKGSVYESLRRLFSGEPTFPLTKEDVAETDEVNQKKLKQKRMTEEERMHKLIREVEEKGGIENASEEERADLQEILLEIKEVVAQNEPVVS